MPSIFRPGFVALLATQLFLLFAPAASAQMFYPADAGIINVKDAPYGAKGDGVTDDTSAIRSAINNPSNYGAIIYFPPGTYRVTDTIECNSTKSGDGWRRVFLFGAGPEFTSIKLADNATGFTSASTPRPVLRWLHDNSDANAFGDGFRNALADMTVDVGSGNVGAVGVKWMGHNQSFIRNIVIKSSDPTKRGKHGLDLSLVSPGPTMFRGITIIGFETGVYMTEGKGLWFTNLTLQNQSRYGIYNERQVFAVENLLSNNTVPVYYSKRRSGTTDGWGQLQLINARLTGGSSTGTAIDNSEGGGLYLRNITTTGYASAVKSFNNETSITSTLPGGTVTEYVSHAVRTLFASPAGSLNLPIEDTPIVPHDPLDLWYNVKTNGAKGDASTDDTAKIQQALDAAAATGKSTVYFPKGSYKISDTLVVTGRVRRLFGAGARFTVADALKNSTKSMLKFQHSGPDCAVDFFEVNYVGGSFYTFEQNTVQPLIIRNLKFGGANPYKNTAPSTRAKLYIEDVASENWHFSNGQNVWARQINPEANLPAFNIKSQSSHLWVFGLKMEGSGVVIETTGGGSTELLGGLVDGRKSGDVTPPNAFINTESSQSLSYVNINTIYSPQISETRAGVNKTLASTVPPMVTKQYSRMLPLFTGYSQHEENRRPVVSAGFQQTITLPATATLAGIASDDGLPNPPAALTYAWSNASGPGTVIFGNASALSTTASFSEPGHYLLRLTVSDGALLQTSDVTVVVNGEPNALPSVSITNPANNASYTAPANITITASATDSDGSVSKVEFYHGATKIGEDANGGDGWSVLWNNVPGGSYSVTARATDNKGGMNISGSIKINIGTPPTATITAPANQSVFTAPASFTITATAADADGSVVKVEFFDDTAKLGEDTNGSDGWSLAVTDLEAGSYEIKAVATDNAGITGASAPVTVIVNTPPVVSLTSPAAGTSFIAPASFTVTADASDTDGTVTKIEFYDGTTKLGEDTNSADGWSLQVTGMAAGSRNLTAKAIDDRGVAATSTAVGIVVNGMLTTYEGFDYGNTASPISLNGLNGGSGWSGAWVTTTGGNATATVPVSGLERTGIESRGNKGSVTRGATARRAVAPVGSPGKTVWAGMLIKEMSNDTSVKIQFRRSGSTVVSLHRSGSDPWDLDGTGSGDIENTTYNNNTSAAHFWLFRFQFNQSGGATAAVWRNPALTSEPVNAPATINLPNFNSFDEIFFQIVSTSSGTGIEFDELRIATSFQAAASGAAATGNQPPQVIAGGAQTILFPNSVSLEGSVTDDGAPNGSGTHTQTWSKVSGPGTVTFENASAAQTNASFSTPGTYVLRLTGTDGTLSASADVSIVVNDSAASWKSRKFTESEIAAGKADDTFDFDGDGISNLLEYGLGLEPKVADSTGHPTVSEENGYLVLTYRRAKSAADLVFTVQASSDLNGAWENNSVTQTIITDGEIQTIKGVDTIPVADRAQRFLRLRVTRP